MRTPRPKSIGFTLPNNSHITHGAGTNSKTVFSDLGFPVTMHELWPGSFRGGSDALSYSGQLGLIDFDTSIRLPRHVHIVEPPEGTTGERKFIHERILVLQGVALVEMNGEIYVIPPRTLVTIEPGVPHTWTACPEGVFCEAALEGSGEDGKRTVSTGSFLMVYEYEDPTSFKPTKQTETLTHVDQYVPCDTEELNEIRIPALSKGDVYERCWFVYDKGVKKVGTRSA